MLSKAESRGSLMRATVQEISPVSGSKASLTSPWNSTAYSDRLRGLRVRLSGTRWTSGVTKGGGIGTQKHVLRPKIYCY